MSLDIVATSATDPRARTMMNQLSERLAWITGDDGRSHFQIDQAPATAGSIFLLALQGDAPVGCGALRALDLPVAGRVGEIKRMYAASGGRGIGEALLAALATHGRNFDYRVVRLATRTVNAGAVRFYLRHGFEICDNYGVYENRADVVCFEKTL